MRKHFGITSIGCLWSTILIAAVSSSNITKPDRSNCTYVRSKLNNTECGIILQWNRTYSESFHCIEEILNSRKYYDPKRQQLYTNLTTEYCAGTPTSQNCSSCFLKAFEHYWNRSICLLYTYTYIDQVTDCLKQYSNDKFNWSRKVIFESYPKVVNLSSETYKTCEKNFTDADAMPKNKEVMFPIYLPLMPDYFDRTYTVLLSLLLEGFEVKNASSSTGVTCQHILDSRLLQNYKYFTEEEIRKTPARVKESYLNLRRSMCFNVSNNTSCEKCFNETDELFLFHLYNADTKASSFRRDFLKINTTLNECRDKYISERYSELKNLTDSQVSWNVSFGDCLDKRTKKFMEIIRNNTQPIIGMGQNEAVVKSVASNYFGYFIYQGLQQNKTNSSCEDVINSRIICAAARTIYAVNTLQGRIFNRTEEEQLNDLALDLSWCGY